MSRTSQNGSIVSFVVVGVLLSAAVLGGLYVVSERSFFGLGEEATEVAQTGEEVVENVEEASEENGEETSEDTTNDVVVDTDEPAQADQDAAVTDEPAISQESTDSTVADESVAESPADSTEASTTEATDEMVVAGVDTDTPSSTTPTTNTQELPSTGPSDAVWGMIGVSSLVAAALMYRRSTQL